MTPSLPASPMTTASVTVPSGSDLSKVGWKSKTAYTLAGSYKHSAGSIALPSDCVLICNNAVIDWYPPTEFSSLFQIQTTMARVDIAGGLTINANAVTGQDSTKFCAISVDGSDITLNGITVVNTSLGLSRYARRVFITNCKAGVLPMYWWFNASGGLGNLDFTFVNLDLAGSTHAHLIRCYNTHRLTIKNSNLRNPESIPRPPGVVHGQVCKFCDGSDFSLVSNVCDGPAQFGPNPGEDGAHALAVQGLQVLNTDFLSGYIRFNAGLSNVDWQGGKVNGTASGSCFSIVSHPGMPVPNGTMKGVAMTYHSAGPGVPQPFSGTSGGWSGNILYKHQTPPNSWQGKVV